MQPGGYSFLSFELLDQLLAPISCLHYSFKRKQFDRIHKTFEQDLFL